MMKIGGMAIGLTLLGLAIVGVLLAWHGFDDVWQAFGQAGWGVLWAALVHMVPMLIAAAAWQQLLPGRCPPRLSDMLYVLWVRAAVNNLLPVARIGGEIVAARLLMHKGQRPSAAIASVVVDTTLSVLMVFLFDLFGIINFGWHVSDGDMLIKLGVGLLVAIPIIVVLVLLPRLGFFGLVGRLLKKITPQHWGNLAVSAARIDRAVLLLYRRRQKIILASVLLLLSWVAGALHIFVAAQALGLELSLWDAVLLEAVVQAVSSAAFMIPGALGALEFAYLFFGGLLGLSEPQALALALMRRARDLIIYLPGLLAWQAAEGRGWWQRWRRSVG